MLLLPLVAVLIQTLDGSRIDALRPPPSARVIVYIFTSTDCPISNRYAPEVRRLAAAFAQKGVLFRLVYPARSDAPDAIRAHMSAYSYDGVAEAVRDPDFALVKFVGATITPEAAIVADGRVVYRGRIDDRYVDLGVERPAPTRRDLADAIAATLAGKPVASATTQAVGCFIADLAR
jgi:hypothetical protein